MQCKRSVIIPSHAFLSCMEEAIIYPKTDVNYAVGAQELGDRRSSVAIPEHSHLEVVQRVHGPFLFRASARCPSRLVAASTVGTVAQSIFCSLCVPWDPDWPVEGSHSCSQTCPFLMEGRRLRGMIDVGPWEHKKSSE